MSANFNYYLNRQGLRGRKGEKGDPGESVSVEVGQNMANTFTLIITTADGTFETPNLRGSYINTTGEGVYLKYDHDTDTIYVADVDEATNSSSGIVRIATSDEIAARDGDGVIQANQLSDILIDNDVLTALPLTKISSTTGNYAGFTIDEENATKTPTVGLYTGNHNSTTKEFDYTAISGGKFGVNAAGTGFDSGNIYIEFPFEEGKLIGGIEKTYISNGTPTFIFGNSDGSVFTPLYYVRFTKKGPGVYAALATGKISSFTDTSITVENRYDYLGTSHPVSGLESPMRVGLISLKQGTDYAVLDGLFSTGFYDGGNHYITQVITNQTVGLTNNELLSFNTVRMYPGNYTLASCTVPLTYTVMGTKEGGVSTINTVNDVLSIGTYELGVNTTKRLTLKYDPNTMGLNGSGALYAKVGTVDDSLSTVSTNPVQNKVITTSINSITGDISTLQTNVGNLQTTIDGGEV